MILQCLWIFFLQTLCFLPSILSTQALRKLSNLVFLNLPKTLGVILPRSETRKNQTRVWFRSCLKMKETNRGSVMQLIGTIVSRFISTVASSCEIVSKMLNKIRAILHPNRVAIEQCFIKRGNLPFLGYFWLQKG